MFRTQANPMDDAVVKATDENLTSENWEYILDVCDRVSASTSGPQQAIASLIKRLAHRNANVQLYTLELANALSQNCGPPLHRELASKAFTDSLLRVASDRNSHAQVKQKVLERMETWTEEFGRNPELGIMEQAYQKLRTQQPGLQAPSKPVKQMISGEDRRKEEDELQMALALSVQQDKVASPAPAGNGGGGGGGEMPTGQMQMQAQSGAQQGTTAATVSRVRALYDFTPSEPGELAFKKNDVIAVLESVYKDWWKGSLHGQTGIFPLNYVEKLQDPTKEELERDAQMEAEVFGEIKSVEKLLALLSVGDGAGNRRGEREEDEIAELYQKTLSIRPKLIELIGKYSQKKDDMTQLNEKFIKARRDYEHLLERSMQAPQYQQYPVRPRQSSYPPQQAPYGGPQQAPPQGYPPQGPPQSAQGYPPQAPFAAQSQQHLPPQQDPQRFYSPAPPSEPPGSQPGYASPYPQANGPSAVQPANAPFHFIPGGVQGPPPQQQQQQQPPHEQQAIRRKPSPQGPPAPANGLSDPYAAALPPAFQGQIRPNSIHTINSGNPQELGTGGYESPVDNRHSYPSAQQVAPGMPQQHQGYPPDFYQLPPQQQQHQAPPSQLQHRHQPAPAPAPAPAAAAAAAAPRTDRDALPSLRQRTHSFESPTSLYSQQPSESTPYSAGGGMPQMPQMPQQTQQTPQQQQQQIQQAPPPQQPNAPPPGIPGGSPTMSPAQYPGAQPYQAYQPFSPHPHPQGQGQGVAGQQPMPVQQQRFPSGSSAGGEDPGSYYR